MRYRLPLPGDDYEPSIRWWRRPLFPFSSAPSNLIYARDLDSLSLRLVCSPQTMPSDTSAAEAIAKAAKTAFEASQLIPTSERVRALHEIRNELEASKASILAANKEDMDVRLAQRLQTCGVTDSSNGTRRPKSRSMQAACPRPS